jgi:hypothetical protein
MSSFIRSILPEQYRMDLPEEIIAEVDPVVESSNIKGHAAEKLIHIYRGWDAFEFSQGGPSIIDFDLTTVDGSASFTSRPEILDALTNLQDQFGDGEEGEFLRSRVIGSIYYLRALMDEKIPFPEYIRSTLGICPEPFSDEEIEKSRQAAIRLLAECSATSSLSMTARNREQFQRVFYLTDQNAIRNGIIDGKNEWLRRLFIAGVPFRGEISLSVEFREVDAYWSNWISGSALNGITLQINLHPRKRYDLGKPLSLCLHEICGHAVQMTIWQDLITKGKMNPACGITTVHSPEVFAAEGLGQTVADLLNLNWTFPIEFLLSRALQYHSLLVLHNAHLKIYAGESDDSILDYACDNLPFSDPENLESEIQDRRDNPLFRTYQLSYSASESKIRSLVAKKSPAQIRSFFVEMYTRPMTAQQLIKFGETGY